MSPRVLPAALVATVFACGVALSAQQSQPPASPMGQSQAASFKVVGCVQNEKDVLKSAMPGKPGMGDEFVLTNAVLKTDAAPTETPEAAAPSEPASAYDAQNRFGKVYRATGDRESELKGYVGQRVEITGTFKHAEDATRELGPTGTSGRAPAAEPSVDNTPEITVASIVPTSGTCTPVK